jgi:ribonuclease E
MPNKMLIDATHPEETRVVVVRGNRVEEFDFETANRKQLRGNIYLAKVTRVEPSLQAAFVEYGGNRHGFLAFSEIHPDYYQIPVADRQALIEADERAHREAEEENENRSNRRRSRHRSSRRRGHSDRIQSGVVEHAEAPDTAALAGHDHLEDGEHHEHGDHEHAGHEHGAHEPATHHDDEGHEVHAYGHHDDEHGHDHHDRDHDDHDHHDDDHDRAAHEPAAASLPGEPRAETPVVAVIEASVAAASHVDDHHDEHADDERAHDEQAQENVAHADDAAIEHAYEAHATSALEEHPEHSLAPQADEHHEDDDGEEDGEEEEVVESVGGDDVLEEVPERPFRPRRQYKIQEVIKRRQVMLVQVVKEERGNKGAALTTYLSLAGRYAVLMPNTARGGGISRKITSAQDRSRLKEVVQDLDVPEGMGIILRTAGASRTKPEIKRDFEYLIRMWETVRDTTLNSQAPTLVYEEGSLIKRSLRDLYNKEIDEILVAGEAGYQEARDFMKMLMPASVRVVKQYRDGQPLFSRMGVESALDAMFSPTVQLRSGGYIVINQTEALVSIDVNSGRATREHHIEDTALKTNIEASEEVARQLRLRDLAGLIVIDFIDMDEKRNNRAVERKLSDCLRQDRARIQVGRISHFGLLEMSRQRIRSSVLESSTESCPQCGGTGHVRSVSSVALQLLRGIEEILMKGATHNLVVRTRNDVALYVLNHKRGHLRDLENAFKVTLAIVSDPNVSGVQSYIIDRGEQVHTLEAAKALLAAQASLVPAHIEEAYDDEEVDAEFESEVESEESEGLSDEAAAGEASEGEGEQDGQGQRRGKRRRRRRGRGGSGEGREATGAPREEGEAAFGEASPPLETTGEEGESEEDESEEQPGFAREGQANDGQANGDRRPRRRGRRGGRRRRGGERADEGQLEGQVGSITDELTPPPPPEAADAVADFDGRHPQDALLPEVQPEPIATAPEPQFTSPEPASPTASEPVAHDNEKHAPRRSTVREKVSFTSSAPVSEVAAPVVHSTPDPAPVTEPVPEAAPSDDNAPRKAGWWSRRFGGGE